MSLEKHRSTCPGNGECLKQTEYENHYTIRTYYTCSHDCKPIKCPNYLFCNSLCPQWYLYCHKGFCVNCAICYGKLLNTMDNVKCTFCTKKNTLGVQNPKCDHYLCVDCFKRLYYGPDDDELLQLCGFNETQRDIVLNQYTLEPPSYLGKCPLCKK